MSNPDVSRAARSVRLGELLHLLRTWPWRDAVHTLGLRFREDRLGLTAGSLTFTTLIALVPLVTVMLAAFSAFPMFSSFQSGLEKYFLQSLVPDNLAKPVLATLTQFAAKAKRLGGVGLVILVFTALSLMLTIDRSLNAIWRVPKPRPIAQRVLVYWAALTLGPVALGVSLTLTSYAISASKGLVSALPGGVSLLLDAIQFGLLAAGMAGLFHYVPNTHVLWRHAVTGGLFVAVGFELAKKVLAWYLVAVPSFATVYGAFATVPIFLIWVFAGWVIVLLGAVIAAYAPSVSMHIVRRPLTPGHQFALALAVLRQLLRARAGAGHGMSLVDMATDLRCDPLQVEPVIDALIDLDWVARLDEPGVQRYALLCEPAGTAALPLLDRLLLDPTAATQTFRQRAGFAGLRLDELL